MGKRDSSGSHPSLHNFLPAQISTDGTTAAKYTFIGYVQFESNMAYSSNPNMEKVLSVWSGFIFSPCLGFLTNTIVVVIMYLFPKKYIRFYCIFRALGNYFKIKQKRLYLKNREWGNSLEELEFCTTLKQSPGKI